MKIFLATLYIFLIQISAGAQVVDEPVLANGEAIPVAVPKQDDNEFLPNRWTDGLHIFAGMGLNASMYDSDLEFHRVGIGSNFKTDVGWYFYDKWAIESSSSVKFNRLDGNLIWDTLITLGVRYRFTEPVFHFYGNYGRFFVGSAPTVVFLDGERPDEYKNASRVHFEGPVVGFGFGSLYKSDKGPLWFIELNVSYQYLRTRDEVIADGETPVIISSESVDDHSRIYSFYATVGILLF